jgi:hypothetical protein
VTDIGAVVQSVPSNLLNKQLESAAARNGQIPKGGNGEGAYKHSAVENRAGDISKDWENGPGMNLIAPTPTTYLVSQVGHIIMFAMFANNKCHQSNNACVNSDAKGTNLICLLCRLKIKTT